VSGIGGLKYLDHTPRKTFDEKLDCFWVSEMITGDSGETFEVIGVLGRFQATSGGELSTPLWHRVVVAYLDIGLRTP